MKSILLLGIAGFFAALMINRSIAASALRKLDDETKLKFIEVFTKRSNFLSLGSGWLIILFTLGMQLSLSTDGHWSADVVWPYSRSCASSALLITRN